MTLRSVFVRSAAAAICIAMASPASSADDKYVEDGKYFTKSDDTPTFDVAEDGTVDWYTYSGFRRYHSECHVCHGPDGLGSTYAPALAESLKEMSYDDFVDVVINGRERTTASGAISKMPAFGENVNVTCYMDDLYVYAAARAVEAIPRGRPKKRQAKPAAAKEDENACRGDK